MNRLSLQDRAKILQMLVEGNSLRSTSRMADVSLNTVTKLIVDIGCACAAYHHNNVRNLRVRRLQCDEIWSFVGAKKQNVTLEQEANGWGDVWTWTAIDADTKFCVTYYVGDRGKHSAYQFMRDAANRIAGRPQITTDAHRPYLQAVEEAFGMEVDYAMLHKIYGEPTPDESRYSPATCIGCDMKTVMGDPDPEHVSTSYVEGQNLTPRMSNRRFTRLTNAFSKKLENHGHMVALHFLHYNFARIPVTPAMAAGISDHAWSMEEIAMLADAPYTPKKRGPYEKQISN